MTAPWRVSSWATAAAGVVVAGVLSGPVSAHADVVATPPGQVSTVTASIAMDNDWQFVDAECLFIPILATFGRADNTSVLGETTVTKAGSDATSNEGTFLVLPGDPVAGELLDEIFVCPADGTGEYRLDTTIRAINPDSEESFALAPLTFWVRPATTTIADFTARVTKGGVRVSGDTRAGDGVATGIVDIRYRLPGTSRWQPATSVPLQEGSFSALVEADLPPRTRYRATVTECSWCSRASARITAS